MRREAPLCGRSIISEKVLGICTAKLTCADGAEQTDVTMLPSAFFAITKQEDGGMVLYGGGYGHGLGMSQNAANGMAKAGMNYEEILQYFFTRRQTGTMETMNPDGFAF